MFSLMLALTLAATPFEDIHHRFIIELPRGWKFAPLPGDTQGATFHRETDGVFANAAVRVMNFQTPVSLERFAAGVSAASEGEPGYRLLSREPVAVAGFPGERRRFIVLINGDAHLPKMVEERMTVVGQTGYVVHLETLADAFGVFESDIMLMAESFRPGGAPHEAVLPARKLHIRQLWGHWHSLDGAHSLALLRSGYAELDNKRGTWSLEDGLVVLNLGNQRRMYEAAVRSGQLTLTGGEFAEGATFAPQIKHAHKARHAH